jgi:hypothetical protein
VKIRGAYMSGNQELISMDWIRKGDPTSLELKSTKKKKYYRLALNLMREAIVVTKLGTNHDAPLPTLSSRDEKSREKEKEVFMESIDDSIRDFFILLDK